MPGNGLWHRVFDLLPFLLYNFSMKKYFCFLLIPFLFFASCETKPPVVAEAPQEIRPVPEPPVIAETEYTEPEAPVEEAAFDPGNVSQEVYETTLVDIQQLVLNLNRIIRARDFDTWLLDLSDDYRNWLNSSEFIIDLHERYPAFRETVRSARDYFIRVVVPSRANDHVDDIEFITETQVKAYSEDARGQRVVLYSLENVEGKWKITN